MINGLTEITLSAERTLAIVPKNILSTVPGTVWCGAWLTLTAIASFLRDKNAYMVHINEEREASGKDVNGEERYEWTKSMFTDTDEPIMILRQQKLEDKGSRRFAVVHMNRAAKRMLPRSKLLEDAVTSGYRDVVEKLACDAEANVGHTVKINVMIAGLNPRPATVRMIGMKAESHVIVVSYWQPTPETNEHVDGTTAAVQAASSTVWLNVPTLVLSLRGLVVACNNGAKALLGGGELKDKLFKNLFSSESMSDASALITSCLANTDTTHASRNTARLVCNGTVLCATATATTYSAVNEVRYIVVSLDDMTEQMEIEQSVRHQSALTAAMTDILPIGIMIANSSGQIMQVNAAASTIIGSSPLGSSIDTFFITPIKNITNSLSQAVLSRGGIVVGASFHTLSNGGHVVLIVREGDIDSVSQMY